MQAAYPKKLNNTYWDRVNLEYPIKKFPRTNVSSKTIGHDWRVQPEILKCGVSIHIYIYFK